MIARRVILWTALGTVIAFAAHELRDRSHRSRQEAARLQAGLTELTVLKDRDRIAADLQDKVIQQVFAAGLDLQGTALRANQPEVRERILASADDLDQVIRLIRNTIFGLEELPQGRGLHAELRDLFSQLSAATEISFTGPVDGALDPVRATRLVQTLKDALEVISSYSMPARVAITTSDTAYVTEIETTSAVLGADDEFPPWVAGLTRSTSQAGISLSITPASDRTRFAWSILLAGPAGQPPQPEEARRKSGPGHWGPLTRLRSTNVVLWLTPGKAMFGLCRSLARNTGSPANLAGPPASRRLDRTPGSKSWQYSALFLSWLLWRCWWC